MYANVYILTEMQNSTLLSKNNWFFLGLLRVVTGFPKIFFFNALRFWKVSEFTPVYKLSVAIAIFSQSCVCMRSLPARLLREPFLT